MAHPTTPDPDVVRCLNRWRHGPTQPPPAVARVAATDDTLAWTPRCQSCINALRAAYARRAATLEVVDLHSGQPVPDDHDHDDG